MEAKRSVTTSEELSDLRKRKVNGLSAELNKTSSPNGTGTHSSGNQNGLQEKKGRLRVKLADIFDPSEMQNIYLILFVRIFSIAAWTLSILYATYHVYLACEEHLDVWYKDPIMNPGMLSTLINRGRDSTDYEWEMFTHSASYLWFWYGLFVIMSRMIRPVFYQNWNFISTTLSILMFWNIIGFLPTVFLVFQPVIYWSIAQTRSKLLAWAATFLFIYNLNVPIIYTFLPDNRLSEYFFIIAAAWNYARCISFCYDVWDKTRGNNGNSSIGLMYLGRGIQYCLYLPLAITGPLVTYENFENHIINRTEKEAAQNITTENFIKFLKNLFRIGLNVLFIEIILHTLYFRSLSMTIAVHRQLSLWAICGSVYWLGQFFSMKYKVLYGIPTIVAELDGMEMPPLPKCPSYLHRYSVLWRDFDRGLYQFLVKYIYKPTLTFLQSADETSILPLDVKKLMASFMTFVYVYVWHSLSFDVFVWTVLNFLGITIERIGSLLKREIDKRGEYRPIDWDFIIEPIVTVPLAAMSILNSSIFCGSLPSAVSFSSQLWNRREDNYVLIFLYFFTHTAVTLRTWNHKLCKLWMQIVQQ